jgi:poly(A) polymerase
VRRLNPVPAFLQEGPAAKVLAILDRDGEEARVVGGAVRQAVLGLPAGEIDIATTATPDIVTERAKAAGFKTVPTGFEHGTVTIVVDHIGFEVTTLRRDIETFGRHARVVFGRDWAEDAARRDFTVNAMSLDRSGELFDPFKGEADLAAGHIRFIGDAGLRVREDALRILRFFRFHASIGAGEPDRTGLLACIHERALLTTLSRERVRMELVKLVAAPGAPDAVAIMSEAGLLGALLGGVPLPASFARLAAIEARLGLAPEAARRLAALGVLVQEDAARLRERLRLTNEEFRRLDGIGYGWRGLEPAKGEIAAKTALAVTGPRGFRDRVLIAFARSGAAVDDAVWRDLASLPDRWQAPMFPIAAADFIARGLAEGPALGAALIRAKSLWMAADFPRERARLDAIITAAVAG